MNHEKISIRGFPGFAPSTETSSRTQEKTSGAKDIGPRVKFIILNIFSESNLYDDLNFPPKIGGGFYKFLSSIKKMTLM